MLSGPFTLALRGLEEPTRIPRYLLGRLFPESRFGPTWRHEGDYVTFRPGGFAATPDTRPAFAASVYCESRTLQGVLDEHVGEVGAALEVGCGYGRLTPWIDEYARETHGVDVNADALADARSLHPEVEFLEASADDLPYDDDCFDLVVTWTVLMHVPPTHIDDAAAEIVRVLAPGGTLVCCENHELDGEMMWARTPDEYAEMFAPLTHVATEDRELEPTYDGDAHPGSVMVFG